jgi:hypothetical protein
LPPTILGYNSSLWSYRHKPQFIVHRGTSAAASGTPGTALSNKLAPGTCSAASLSLLSLVEVEVKLLPTVSRPVYLGVGPSFLAHDQILLLPDNCGLYDMGHPLRREGGSVIYSSNSLVDLQLL